MTYQVFYRHNRKGTIGQVQKERPLVSGFLGNSPFAREAIRC